MSRYVMIGVGVALLSFADHSWAARQKVTVAGSSTIQPLMEVIGQELESSQGIVIDVQGGGSSVGITAPQSGLADIGMVSRDLHEDEKKILTPIPIAKDGLALIVHAANPLTDLTSEQVIHIYTGKMKSWDALGGLRSPITVINKEEGRATLELFEKFFDLKGKIIASALVIGPNGQAIASVAGNPNSIAYVSIGSAAVAEEQGIPIRRLSLDGIPATAENVKNGRYRLQRALHLVTLGPPQGGVKALIDFTLSPEGQKRVAAQDFVPLSLP